MPFEPQESPALTDVYTLVFVDVDGVLNVGSRDTGYGPLILSDANIKHCRRLWENRENERERDSIERVMSMCNHELGHGEDATYSKLASTSPSHVSEILVARLAELIREAGPRRTVVLSSTWQRPQHRKCRTMLEEVISKYLGSRFVFDATTESLHESCAEGRLWAIGRYVARFCAQCKQGGQTADRLRILVLEDFYITRMGGWSCEGAHMGSAGACEQYLREKAYTSLGNTGEESDCKVCVDVKVAHTYDEWMTPGGLSVQVGCGLTQEHYQQALKFLETETALDQDGHPCTQTQAAEAVEDHVACSQLNHNVRDEHPLYTDGAQPFVLSSNWSWPWLLTFMLKGAVH